MSTTSMRSRPVVGNSIGSPIHCGRAAAVTSASQASTAIVVSKRLRVAARAERASRPESERKKGTYSAASRLPARGMKK